MRFLASMLQDVHANDPITMIGVAVLLTLVAVAACYVPARRAMRVDPSWINATIASITPGRKLSMGMD